MNEKILDIEIEEADKVEDLDKFKDYYIGVYQTEDSQVFNTICSDNKQYIINMLIVSTSKIKYKLRKIVTFKVPIL